MNNPNSKSSGNFLRKTGGFTLIELLVAASLTIILGMLLLSAAQGVITGFTRTQANIIRQGDLSFALDQLVLDLEGLVIPNKAGSEGLRITTETVGAATNVPWLTFLATAMDEDNSTPVKFNGATRAISYRIANQRTIPNDTINPPTYGIYRSIASAAHTFRNAMGVTNLQAQYWSSIPGSPSPAPSQPTAIGNLMVENVVSFQVLFQYQPQNSTNVLWTKPGDQVSIRRDGNFLNGNPIGRIVRAQVSVTAVSPEGARRLQDGSLSFDEVVRRFGTTVVRQTAFF